MGTVMEQLIPWLLVVLMVGVAFWAIARQGDRLRKRSVEEYERDVRDSRDSLLRAGMLELDMVLMNRDQKRAAIEYIRDEKSGETKHGTRGDDRDRTAG